jgi:hypothetical protein
MRDEFFALDILASIDLARGSRAGAPLAPRHHELEPDMQISRIRLSDKTSRLRPRHVATERGQTYEPEVPVKVREWIKF